MTDRELLELSAKAAGIRLEWDGDPRNWHAMYYEGKTYHSWEPLDDDGQALRLAAICFINLEFAREYVIASGPQGDASVTYNPGRSEAARRAIVEAAAKIGKAL